MLGDNELISALELASMDAQEARLYLLLARRGEQKAGDLHRVTGLNRPRTYAILSKMVNKGYCSERLEGRNRYYQIVPPATLLEGIFARWDSERTLIQEAFDQLEKIHSSVLRINGSLDNLQVIRDRDQLHMAYVRLLKSVEKEFYVFTRPPYTVSLNPKGFMQEQEDALKAAIERGVRYKGVMQYDGTSLDLFMRSLKMERAIGAESRITNHLPVKMSIFDRTTLMIALPDVPGSHLSDFTGLVIRDPGQASAYMHVFEYYWEHSSTYEQWIEEHKEAINDLK